MMSTSIMYIALRNNYKNITFKGCELKMNSIFGTPANLPQQMQQKNSKQQRTCSAALPIVNLAEVH